MEYFEILQKIIEDNQIPPENIYNMDEKGIQMGVGKRTLVLVDWDQKTVQQVEDGNRKLVTVIKCVSADGSVLHPSVIYKGKRRDLEWGRDNPCKARLALFFLHDVVVVADDNKFIIFTKWLDRHGARIKEA
jgi:hypothetical protein